MTNKERLRLLFEACEKAQANGLTVIPRWFSQGQRVCPLVALLRAHRGIFGDYPRVRSVTTKAAKLLEFSHEETWAFIGGFDGPSETNVKPKGTKVYRAYQLGLDLRNLLKQNGFNLGK